MQEEHKGMESRYTGTSGIFSSIEQESGPGPCKCNIVKSITKSLPLNLNPSLPTLSEPAAHGTLDPIHDFSDRPRPTLRFFFLAGLPFNFKSHLAQKKLFTQVNNWAFSAGWGQAIAWNMRYACNFSPLEILFVIEILPIKHRRMLDPLQIIQMSYICSRGEGGRKSDNFLKLAAVYPLLEPTLILLCLNISRAILQPLKGGLSSLPI